MSKKTIVWVGGISAVGKETFLKAVTSEDDLKSQLGWADKSVALSQKSIDYIGQFLNDPTIDLRMGIIHEVTQILLDNDVVLIKWQIVDSDAGIPQHLLDLFPEAKHKFCIIEAPYEALIERLVHKSWWDPNDDPAEYVNTERAILATKIAELGSNFDLIRVANDSESLNSFSVVPVGKAVSF